MTISVAPVATAVVVLTWVSGHHMLAVELALMGLAVYMIECAFFDMGPCSCEHGRVRSPLGLGFRVHRRCGGTGVRKRLGRRVWDGWRG